jgi:hypothetical protein
MVKKAGASAWRPIGWRDVLGAVQRDETRSWLTDRFRDSGFTADSFASQRKAREAVADCLTRLEDWIGNEHPGWKADLAGIKAVRRRLELELWP